MALERVRGVEPLSTGWKPVVIPLYHTRDKAIARYSGIVEKPVVIPLYDTRRQLKINYAYQTYYSRSYLSIIHKKPPVAWHGGFLVEKRFCFITACYLCYSMWSNP